jgi:putative transposase
MPDKFQNKYRIPSARASWWNYASYAAYFVTICTKHRQHYFGEIVETQCIASASTDVETQCVASASTDVETQCVASLQPTVIGNIKKQEWLNTPSIRPDMNLELDEFIIMPNHFHAIIWIGENEFNRDVCICDCRDAMHRVSTIANTNAKNATVNKFGPQSKNLSSIIRGFKSAVTTYATTTNIAFGWQSRFHDHIIRDEESYQRIKN